MGKIEPLKLKLCDILLLIKLEKIEKFSLIFTTIEWLLTSGFYECFKTTDALHAL